MKIAKNRLYYHIPAHRLLKNFDESLRPGVNYEIYTPSWFIDSYSRSDIDLINRSFRQKGISKRLHGPFMDLCPGSSDKKVRALSRQRILAGLKLCQKLECRDMVLHSHYDPIYHKRRFGDWFDYARGVWRDVSAEAEKRGIKVYIENSVDDTHKAVMAILKECPAFKACFDLAHYTVFGADDWKDILKAYPQGSIGEVHLSDNDATEDLHMVLGHGKVDVEGFLSELDKREEEPVITIEPHSAEDLLLDMKYIERFLA